MRRLIDRLPQSRTLKLGITVALVTAFSLTASASWAGWNAQGAKSATATNGSISIVASGAASLSGDYTSVHPSLGTSTRARTTVMPLTNSGSVPVTYTLSVTGAANPLASAVQLQVWVQVSGSCATIPAGTPVGTLAAPPAMPAAAASAIAGQTHTLCVRTALTGTHEASLGQTVTPAIVFTGRVGTAWSSADSETFTQQVQASWYQIVHNHSGKCLDGFSESSTSGTDLIIWPCKALVPTNNQAWRFANTTGVNYRVHAGYAPNLVWTAEGASNGSEVALITVGATRQEWTLVAHGPAGYFQLRNVAAGRCLNVNGTDDETIATVRTCTTSTLTNDTNFRAQHFSLVAIP